jgi:hypothetical protein
MYLQLLVELIHNLSKCFSHYEIPIAIGTHYHTIYLIFKLIRIIPMFIRIEDCSISIGPFIDPLSPAS